MRRPLVAALLTFLLPAAHAGEPAASECVHVENDAARLECYDTAFGRSPAHGAAVAAASASGANTAGRGAANAPPTAPATSTSAAATAGPAATFGVPEPRAESTPKELTELQATVASVAVQPHTGRWTVTLDNGQVWEGLGTANELHQPRQGDPVTIRKASFGSYLMYNEKRGLSRVRRVH